MRRSRIQAIDHVRREAPPGLVDDLRWFYGVVGCLDEVTEEESDASRLRFRSERIELQIRLVANPKIDSTGYPVTLAVPSLEEAAELLDEHKVAYQPLTGITWADFRLAANDPSGNRVELKQQWPDEPL